MNFITKPTKTVQVPHLQSNTIGNLLKSDDFSGRVARQIISIFNSNHVVMTGFDDRYFYFLIERAVLTKKIGSNNKIIHVEIPHVKGGRFDRRRLKFEIIYHRDCQDDKCSHKNKTVDDCKKGHYWLHQTDNDEIEDIWNSVFVMDMAKELAKLYDNDLKNSRLVILDSNNMIVSRL